MFRKHNVRFPAEGGIEISAWLFVPEGRTSPLPGITMTHGYAGTKYHGLEPLAEAFVDAGFVVPLHDHRNLNYESGRREQNGALATFWWSYFARPDCCATFPLFLYLHPIRCSA